MASKKKQVAKKDDGEMTFDETRPDYVIEEGVRGQENVDSSDLIIPRLGQVQSISPQRKKNDPAYIEGAEDGMFFNTVTNELYGLEVYFIPVYFMKEWLIWKQQAAGGGFQGSFESELAAGQEYADQGYDKETFTVKGVELPAYEIVDTMNHFGLIFNKMDHVSEISCSMSKSKAKISRQLNTLVRMHGGDRFSRVYKIVAIEDQNKEGQPFYNMKIVSLGYAPKDLYEMGEKMYGSVSELGRKVAHEDKAPSKEEGTEY